MSLQLGIPLFIIASIIQATILPRFHVLGGQPDLVVLLVLAWAILDKNQEGIVWGFVGGLFLDLFSTTPFGLSAITLVIVAFIVGLSESQVYRESLVLPLVVALVGAGLYHFIYMILLRFIGGVFISWADVILYVTLPSLLFDVILMVPILRLLSGPYDRLHPRTLRF